MLSLWNGLDDLLRMDEFFRASRERNPAAPERGSFVPPVDIREEEQSYLVTVELPGLRVEDVALEVDGNVLTLSGERRLQKSEATGSLHRVERRYGAFSRRFVLPDTVDSGQIEAEMQDGVLHVRLPKVAVRQARKIEVRRPSASANAAGGSS